MDTQNRYEFGDNWSRYIDEEFNEKRLEAAKQHLLDFLKLADLSGRSFIDVGCGSGLHSCAALQAGAEKITSFDYDDLSVSATRKLHEFAGKPAQWEIRQGSILDKELVESLPKYDIVYSWGVLHHTGNMWEAMNNITSFMHESSVLYLSLYTSDVFTGRSPEFWLKVKQVYNRSGTVGKRLMEVLYALRFAPFGLLTFLHGKFTRTNEKNRGRGMSFWVDIRDWLGGWPMEFAGISEVKDFYAGQHGLELLNISAGEATTEYLFRKRGAVNYWDDYIANHEMISLTPPFLSAGKHAWSVDVPVDFKEVSNADFMLYEDGIPVGFSRLPRLGHIRKYGKGRYSYKGGTLLFSTTDNSDPNKNGREYSYRIMSK